MTRRKDVNTAEIAAGHAGMSPQADREVAGAIAVRRPLESTVPAHRAAIEEGLAQLDRGEFATDAEIQAVFRRAGL
jgi:hypothetical protein